MLEVRTHIRSGLCTNLACHAFRFQAGRCLLLTEVPTMCRQLLPNQASSGGVDDEAVADSTSTNAASDGDGDDGDDTERRSLWRISFAGWWGSARLRLP